MKDKIKKMKELNIIPEWLDKVFTDEPLDNETKEIFDDFDNFIKEFRNDTNNNI